MYIYVYIYIYMYIYIYIYTYICMYIYICLCVCVSVCLCLSVSVSVSCMYMIYMCIHNRITSNSYVYDMYPFSEQLLTRILSRFVCLGTVAVHHCHVVGSGVNVVIGGKQIHTLGMCK